MHRNTRSNHSFRLEIRYDPEQIAVEFDLPLSKIQEAQEFYHSQQVEIDANIIAEKAMEDSAGK